MEIWVLGASGRTGRAVTAALAERGLEAVLVGRDRTRLEALGGKFVVADGADAIAAEIGVVGRRSSSTRSASTRRRPRRSPRVPARGSLLDLAADSSPSRGCSTCMKRPGRRQHFLTGVGFGVLATEAVVVKLCEERPTPASVRVDALASVAVEEGAVGVALAASIVDALTTATSGAARGPSPAGRRVDDGGGCSLG